MQIQSDMPAVTESMACSTIIINKYLHYTLCLKKRANRPWQGVVVTRVD